MGNIVTAFFAFVACFFFHFRENNDKVPESSKNGPKKVPILPVRPEFCQCKDFLSQVPNPIFFFGAPVCPLKFHIIGPLKFIVLSPPNWRLQFCTDDRLNRHFLKMLRKLLPYVWLALNWNTKKQAKQQRNKPCEARWGLDTMPAPRQPPTAGMMMMMRGVGFNDWHSDNFGGEILSL